MALIVALVYAELASTFGSAGGEYVYVEKIFGEIAAYPVIVVNLITLTFITSVLALGAGDYFRRLMPLDPKFSALIIVFIATLFGILHIRTNAKITAFFFFMELAALGVLSYFAVGNMNQNFTTLFEPVMLTDSKLTATPFFTIVMATGAALFAFNGYEQAVYLVENMKKPRLVARAVLICLILGFLLETIPTVLTVLASNDISKFTASTSPYLDLVTRVAGPRFVTFISSAVALAVLNACIANVLMTARFVYSTARSGLWGAGLHGPLTALNTKSVPVAATLLVGVLGGIACFLPIDLLFILTGTGLTFIYAALCVALIAYRHRPTADSSDEKGTHFRMPFTPVLPALGLAGLIGVLVASWVDPSVGRYSIIASLAEIVAGLLLWFIQRKVLSMPPLSSHTDLP